MGLPSARTNVNPSTDPAVGYRIIDTIDVKSSYGIGVSGFVLILEDFRPTDPESLVGRPVEIRLNGGWSLRGEIARVRDHGATSSILLADWPEDFPQPSIGWQVEIQEPRQLHPVAESSPIG